MTVRRVPRPRSMAATVFAAVVVLTAASTGAWAQGGLLRRGGAELTEALGEFVAKGGGRTVAQELESLGGEAVLRQIAERSLKGGGDEALEELVALTVRHGADARRAAENAPDLGALTQVLREFSEEETAVALRRLGAGDRGRALSLIV